MVGEGGGGGDERGVGGGKGVSEGRGVAVAVGIGAGLEMSKKVAEAMAIKGLLEQNTDEVTNLLRALDGSYVKPGVGGAFVSWCRRLMLGVIRHHRTLI